MKYIAWALLLSMSLSYASAQEVYNSSGKQVYHKHKKKGFDPARLILGGSPNVSFDGGYLDLGASAIAGYSFTSIFSAGLGLGYLYARSPYSTDPTNANNILYEKENIVYPSLWTRMYVYKNVFVTGVYEFDIMSEQLPLNNYGNVARTTTDMTNSCLFVGAGIREPLGGRLAFYGELLYDILQGKDSPYYPGLPQIQVGIAVGL